MSRRSGRRESAGDPRRSLPTGAAPGAPGVAGTAHGARRRGRVVAGGAGPGEAVGVAGGGEGGESWAWRSMPTAKAVARLLELLNTLGP